MSCFASSKLHLYFFLNNSFLSSNISSLRSLSCFIFKVLPSLREKHDEFMLRELVKRWTNHKIMVRWLSRFFHYLDRYFIARRSLPALNEVGLTCFRDLVHIFPCYFTFNKFTYFTFTSLIAWFMSRTFKAQPYHFLVVSCLNVQDYVVLWVIRSHSCSYFRSIMRSVAKLEMLWSLWYENFLSAFSRNSAFLTD